MSASCQITMKKNDQKKTFLTIMSRAICCFTAAEPWWVNPSGSLMVSALIVSISLLILQQIFCVLHFFFFTTGCAGSVFICILRFQPFLSSSLIHDITQPIRDAWIYLCLCRSIATEPFAQSINATVKQLAKRFAQFNGFTDYLRWSFLSPCLENATRDSSISPTTNIFWTKPANREDNDVGPTWAHVDAWCSTIIITVFSVL